MIRFIALSFLISSFAQAACPNKVDPSKVMLFIDTNTSDMEIDTVEAAACARGQTVKIIPKNYKEITVAARKVEQARKSMSDGKCLHSIFSRATSATPECAKLKENYMKATSDLQAINGNQDIKSRVKTALNEIKASNAKIEQVSISGHDGGGHFGGLKGSFSREDLAQLMNEHKDINNVKSLLLLGCYTGTQKEVLTWKGIFPGTKMIGGYDGSAPLSDRPQGHKFITELLTKEGQLIRQADEKKLENFVAANVRSLSGLNAGVYVQCEDGDKQQEYYYGSKKGRNFNKSDLSECAAKKTELEEVQSEFHKYQSGELAVPADTQAGALRVLYNKARTYEHCAEIVGVTINVQGIFNMLFYQGVTESFADYYKNDLSEVEKDLNLDPKELEKNFAQNMQDLKNEITQDEAQLKLLKEEPAKYFAQQDQKLAAEKIKAEALLKDPKYNAVARYFSLNSENLEFPRDISGDQMKLYIDLHMKVRKFVQMRTDLRSEKSNPQQAQVIKAQYIKHKQHRIEKQTTVFQDFLTKAKDPKFKVWSPTSENLKKHSRAELMANIHNMNSLMNSQAVSKSQRRSISWLATTTSRHLSYFENPFEWHEYTGHPVKPQNSMSLKEAQAAPDKDYDSVGYY